LPVAPCQGPPAAIQRPFAAYDKHRRWNGPIARVLVASPSTDAVGRDIANCCRRIGVVLELGDAGAVAAYLRAGRFCNRRLCPFCEWRRSQAWRARLFAGLERYAADRPTDRAIFLTLTVRNCPVSELRETIQDIHRGWDRLSRLAAFPAVHWLRRTELTVASPDSSVTNRGKNPTGKDPAADRDRSEDDPTDTPRARLAQRVAGVPFVHPHVHALLLVPSRYFGPDYVSQMEWQAMWQMSARLDYPPVVDIRTAYSDEHKARDRAPLGKVVKEAAKYAAKAADVVKLGPYAVELHEQLKGLKLIQTSRKFGAYVKSSPPKDEELLDTLREVNPDKVYAAMVAAWNEASEAYELDTLPDA
jgi:plasmid rolling circle replication initiator protein Rep